LSRLVERLAGPAIIFRLGGFVAGLALLVDAVIRGLLAIPLLRICAPALPIGGVADLRVPLGRLVVAGGALWARFVVAGPNSWRILAAASGRTSHAIDNSPRRNASARVIAQSPAQTRACAGR
jgi:hypothetical protein